MLDFGWALCKADWLKLGKESENQQAVCTHKAVELPCSSVVSDFLGCIAIVAWRRNGVPVFHEKCMCLATNLCTDYMGEIQHKRSVLAHIDA